MIKKQLVLGGTLLLGGSVALFALTQKNNDTEKTATVTQKTATVQQDEVTRPTVQPLTTDLETERRILEQKRQEREARALEQERQIQALHDEQEKAKNDALKKAQAEIDAKVDAKKASTPEEQTDSTPATLTIKTRPEVIKAQQEAKKLEAQKEAKKQNNDPKKTTNEQAKAKEADKTEPKKDTTPKGHHLVKQGDTLLKVSRQYNIPVSAIASVNKMGRNDALTVGKTIKIPTKAEIAKLAEADKVARAKAEKEKADKAKTQNTKTEQAKKSDTTDKKSNKVPRHYSVQVGLLPKDQAAALAKEYRKAGYKVQTSQTSRGVRVLVGSSKTEAEANTLKNKIIKDSRVKTDGAWVKEVDEINAP